MLAVVYKGIAIPLFWLLLNKRGNSCSIERIALIKRFIRVFGKDKIHQILADREFVGEKWFKWLNENEIKFCIRVRKNSKVSNRYGQLVQVHSLFHNLRKGQQIQHDRQVKIDGVNVYLSVLKLQDGELLIVATNQNDADALESYAKRWEIETLFSCLKSRGFNLEDSHLTDMKKIKKLLVVYAIAFCWCYSIGEWQHEKVNQIKIKKHGRPMKSVFRLGLDIILDILKGYFFKQRTTDFIRIIGYLKSRPRYDIRHI